MIAAASVRAEADRAPPLPRPLAEAGARDVVLIAGKGHEDYQETAGVRQPFSDMAQARAALARRGAAGMACTPHDDLQQAFACCTRATPAARLVGDGATPLARVHTDTRTLQPGDLFVALQGRAL